MMASFCNYIQYFNDCKHSTGHAGGGEPEKSGVATQQSHLFSIYYGATSHFDGVLPCLDSDRIFVILQRSVLTKKEMGGSPIFCLWRRFAMELQTLLEVTLSGLGYELVDWDRSGRGRLLRVFIDKLGGISVDDCAAVSHHLTRVLAVENVDYDRMEVSSPGLDRPLKKERDFARYTGHKARIRMRIPIDGQRNFVGVLREVSDGAVLLDVDGRLLSLDLGNLEKARLVPAL
jgi:ribosome maturation factor RimP